MNTPRRDRPAVAVVGSVNIDDIYRVASLPVAGETVTGASYLQLGGGKGANQAAGATYDGGPVHLVAMVGPEADGAAQLSALQDLGVTTTGVAIGTQPTGRAAVVTSPTDNQIVVASGANHELGPAEVNAGLEACSPAVVLICAEITDSAMAAAAAAGRSLGAHVVFNAAPARPLPVEVTDGPLTLIVNEGEAAELAGTQSWVEAVDVLTGRHPEITLVITLGSDGIRLIEPGQDMVEIPALPAPEVVDTTGAGDAFCGVYAAALATGLGAGVPAAGAAQAGAACASAAVRLVGARTWLTEPLPPDVSRALA